MKIYEFSWKINEKSWIFFRCGFPELVAALLQEVLRGRAAGLELPRTRHHRQVRPPAALQSRRGSASPMLDQCRRVYDLIDMTVTEMRWQGRRAWGWPFLSFFLPSFLSFITNALTGVQSEPNKQVSKQANKQTNKPINQCMMMMPYMNACMRAGLLYLVQAVCPYAWGLYVYTLPVSFYMFAHHGMKIGPGIS